MFENALSENRLQLIILLKTLKNEENMKITFYRNNVDIIEMVKFLSLKWYQNSLFRTICTEVIAKK